MQRIAHAACHKPRSPALCLRALGQPPGGAHLHAWHALHAAPHALHAAAVGRIVAAKLLAGVLPGVLPAWPAAVHARPAAGPGVLILAVGGGGRHLLALEEGGGGVGLGLAGRGAAAALPAVAGLGRLPGDGAAAARRRVQLRLVGGLLRRKLLRLERLLLRVHGGRLRLRLLLLELGHHRRLVLLGLQEVVAQVGQALHLCRLRGGA